MRSFDCIERPLSVFFFRYGQFISTHPLPFVFVPALLAIFAASGFVHLESVTDAVYLFTPTDAPSKYERQIIHELWPLRDTDFVPGRAVTQSREIQVTIVAKDGGNILEPQYAEAIHRLDMFVQKRIVVKYHNVSYTYKDLCLGWKDQGCPGNGHVQIISDLYNHGFNISYPTFRIGNRGGYLGSALGGVSLSHGPNDTEFVATARAWLMVYQLKFYPAKMSYVSGLWEKAFQQAMQSYPQDPFITVTYLHSQTLPEELKRNADSLVPRFILTFTILVVFSVFCSLSTIDGTFYIDWVLSKPILAVFGVVNAGMAIATSIGLLNLIGIPYCDIVGVMPFLVVAVGIDNMFLMVAAVRHTNRALETSVRIGECMSDAAVSMLITSLTDAFSFGVGTITTIPAVQIFCIYTCLALSLTYVYQITFFAGLLSLFTQWESEGLHSIWLKPTVPRQLIDDVSLFHRLFWMGSRADPDPTNLKENLKVSGVTIFFRDWFAPVLMQPVVKGLAIVWFFIYVGFSIYGCLQLREGLEPVNLLVEDSYAIPHYRVLENYFWHYGAQVQIVVNNAPDLRDRNERRRIESMIHAFANTRHTIGDQSAQFWLYEMERYYRDELGLALVDKSLYRMAQHFFTTKYNDVWEHDVKWGRMPDGSMGITTFRFLVGMRDISRTGQQQETTALMREVAARYPHYNVTTFMPLWLFTDQYDLVVPNTIQDIVIAVIMMIIIAVLLIPQPLCAFWVAFTIGSIDLGVIGFMTLWDVNFDVISMITIVMSVGFSVDYSAHITYGYVIADEPTASGRIRAALGALGGPVTQGATSAILAVVTLSNIPSYTIVTFFKTVFLSISIGLLHGLVFLPVILSLFVRGCCILDGRAGQEAKHEQKHSFDSLASLKTVDSSPQHPSLHYHVTPIVPCMTPPIHPDLAWFHNDEYFHETIQPYGRYGIHLSRVNSIESQSSRRSRKKSTGEQERH
ncbi:hypothetical protein QR680_011394 [Steinernema hermaphroditum]|uniref:SSD domain-containing protein n=1 Tax=Steinernema hermaphroditum TaxID=289476 RepID=A0AA39ITD5_9BILA|nr:hypothetical protein QR680_011394 [Steinernema hermaphroditum]